MKKLLCLLAILSFQAICIGTDIPKDIHVLTRAVIIHDNHLLCAYDPNLKTSTGEPIFYYLPGGHIEYQEPAADSLIRELYKKTGESIEIKGFIGAFERSWLGTPLSLKCHKHEVTLVYKATFKDLSESDLSDVVSKESNTVAFAWLPLEVISSKDLRPNILKDSLDAWLATSSDHVFKGQMHIK